MMRYLLFAVLCIQIAALSGCASLDLPVEISAKNNEHKAILYSELSAVTATETSFTGDFVFQNKSPDALTLQLKATSCGCLSLRKAKQELKYGDSFTIPGKGEAAVSMTMQMPHHPGDNRYGAVFVSNFQGRECETEIAMGCRIVDDMTIYPRTMQVSFDRNTAANRQFSVHTLRSSRNKSDLESPPTLGDLPDHITLQKISVISEPKIAAEGIWQKKWQLDFTVKPPDEMGISTTPVLVNLNSAGQATDFSLVLSKTYGVDAPKQIDFPDTKLTEKRSRVFSVQSATDSVFSIQSISCENSYFTALSEQGTTKAKQHWVEVIFQPQTAGDHRSTLQIETTHPDAKHIRIELVGTAFAEYVQ